MKAFLNGAFMTVRLCQTFSEHHHIMIPGPPPSVEDKLTEKNKKPTLKSLERIKKKTEKNTYYQGC